MRKQVQDIYMRVNRVWLTSHEYSHRKSARNGLRHGSMKEPQPCDPIMGPAQSGQCAPNGDMRIFYLSGIATV